MTITTTAGDELDVLLAARYGDAVNRALSAVLAENLGLARHGNHPPAGTRIVLPDLPATVAERIKLW